MLATLYFSFTRYDLLSTPSGTASRNYVYMFTKDPNFWVAVRNTLWIIVFGVPLSIALSILTAWMLTKPRRGAKVYRTVFFLPSLAPPVAVALAFVFIFTPRPGRSTRCSRSSDGATRPCGSSTLSGPSRRC